MVPPEEKRERNRLAQARFREAHAKRLALAREVTNILVRQTEHRDDIPRLAEALRAVLSKEGVAALRKALATRRTR
jgi:hypothetical protein